MKIDDRYEIRMLIGTENVDGVGDLFDNFELFKKEHPFVRYRFVYCVIDTKTGYIPEGCCDYHDSPEEAIFDYLDNVLAEEE